MCRTVLTFCFKWKCSSRGMATILSNNIWWIQWPCCWCRHTVQFEFSSRILALVHICPAHPFCFLKAFASSLFLDCSPTLYNRVAVTFSVRRKAYITSFAMYSKTQHKTLHFPRVTNLDTKINLLCKFHLQECVADNWIFLVKKSNLQVPQNKYRKLSLIQTI